MALRFDEQARDGRDRAALVRNALLAGKTFIQDSHEQPGKLAEEPVKRKRP